MLYNNETFYNIECFHNEFNNDKIDENKYNIDCFLFCIEHNICKKELKNVLEKINNNDIMYIKEELVLHNKDYVNETNIQEKDRLKNIIQSYENTLDKMLYLYKIIDNYVNN